MSSDEDSEDSRYQPVGPLASRLRSQGSIGGIASGTDSPGRSQWPREAVNVYTNELFKDAEQEANQEQQARAAAGNTSKIQQAKNTAAARRAQRLQANIYTSNDNTMGRAPSTPTPRVPAVQARQGSAPPQASNGTNVYGMRGTFDPNEESTSYSPAAQRRGVVPRAPPPSSWDLSDISAFLMRPGPQEGAAAMCYIVRDKGSAKMYPKYNLYFEDPKTFLCAARKRKKQTTSNYLVSLDREDLNRESEKYYGKLRANFVGTEFTIFDGGAKPGKGTPQRVELGAITYQYNVLGTRGPRKMTGVISALNSQGERLFNPATEADSMLDRVKTNRDTDDLVVMRNKPPRWNEELNAYCLNFNGRVTEASVKNFQLVTDDDQNHVILQFGKIGKNTFTMDYMWPINGFQAFIICLSSFDNKLACE
mmetsp:Transcript_12624/g.22347  ORF Transcript_12624/g.22347 Transcript_12624/m.22347 type:complete len:422 (+) Transcript_12624:173-1438(+)